MNIDFELYRIFYVVANHCNITKASEELSISQPAISKSIKNLEEQLGGQLFVRTKRGVVLTEEGKEFYNYIKQAIEYINNAENKFTDLINLETGCIKIGISTTLTKEFLLPYLEEFHSLYPKIDIQIITNLTSDLMPKLRNGLIDTENATNILEENKIHLTENIFDNDAIIMKNIKSNKVILQNRNTNKKILEFDFTDFPYLALWSKKGAPFVCIEPWQNTADKIDSNQIYKEKENILSIEPDEIYSCKYIVKFY